MSILLGTVAGLGVFLVWTSWCKPAIQQPKKSNGSTVELKLRRAGMHGISTSMFYTISTAFSVVLIILIIAITRLYYLAFILGSIGFFIPRFYIGQKAKKRTAAIRELWPDAVDHLRSAIRAGLSLPEALMQLQYRGPEELRESFESFSADYRSTGEFVASLEKLKFRLADPTADNIIEALKVTREVGGTDLGRLLGTLSEFLRENARTRAELEARQSWTINAAKLAVIAPWVVLCLMATQPATVQAYNSFSGLLVMSAGLVVSFIAYRIMLLIGELPEEKRVLN